MKAQVMLVTVCSALMLAGCEETKTSSASGAPVVMQTISMTGSANPATVAMGPSFKFFDFLFPGAIALAPPALVDSGARSVVLNQAWIVVKEIEFESTELPGVGEVDGTEVEFAGPFYVDLLSATPDLLDTQAIVLQNIRRIKMKLHQNATIPPAAPAGLVNNSMYMEGTVNGVAFSFSSADGAEVHIGGPNPVLPVSGGELLVAIQIANLFKQIDLGSLTVPTAISDGNRVPGVNLCPAIDPSANDIYTCFRIGLETEADMGHDVDGDGDLDIGDDSVK